MAAHQDMAVRRAVATLVEDPPLATIRDVADLLLEVQTQVERLNGDKDNGVACFNRLYADITRTIDHQLEDAPSRGFLVTLDVQFAQRYLRALHAWCLSRPDCPPPWRVLFERHASAKILPVQFALAGVAAHVLFDLAPATAATARMHHGRLRDHDDWHRTYLLVNDVFHERLPPLRERLQPALLDRLAEALPGQVQDPVQLRAIITGRGYAWQVAKTLSSKEPHEAARYERVEAQKVAGLNRVLLSRVGRWLVDPAMYAFGAATVEDSVPDVILALVRDLERAHDRLREHRARNPGSSVRLRSEQVVFRMQVEARTTANAGLRVVGAEVGGAQSSMKGNVLEYTFTSFAHLDELRRAARRFLAARRVCMMDLSDLAIFVSDECIKPTLEHFVEVRSTYQQHLRELRLRLADLEQVASPTLFGLAEQIRNHVEWHVGTVAVRLDGFVNPAASDAEGDEVAMYRGVKEPDWVERHEAQGRCVAAFIAELESQTG